MEKNWDFAWELITEHVAKAFLVSPDVIEKRMEKDGVKKKYIYLIPRSRRTTFAAY